MNFPFELRRDTDRDTEFDVVGFGTNAVDHLIRVAEYPAFNSKVELISSHLMAGGEAASTMVGLQRLGWRTAYLGRFGDDDAGRLGWDSLVAEGVDVSRCETVPGAATQVGYIIIDDATGERTVMWRRDASLGYTARDAPLDVLEKCRVLHLTPHDTEAAIAMATEARRLGVVVSIDIDRSFPGVDSLLPLVDICIASADFVLGRARSGSNEGALSQMSLINERALFGMTLGVEGSLVVCGGEFIRAPGVPTPGECVDTTGAGDAFRTGFLHGLLLGKSVEDTCILANTVASLKCRGLGARSALPDREALANAL